MKSVNDGDESWGTLSLDLCTGGETAQSFINFEFCNIRGLDTKLQSLSFNIYCGDKNGPDGLAYEEIDIDAAYRLRDFLNYVLSTLPKGK